MSNDKRTPHKLICFTPLGEYKPFPERPPANLEELYLLNAQSQTICAELLTAGLEEMVKLPPEKQNEYGSELSLWLERLKERKRRLMRGF